MLYDNRKPGRVTRLAGIGEGWRRFWARQHKADLDLLSLSPHLQRDLGIDQGVRQVLRGRIEHK